MLLRWTDGPERITLVRHGRSVGNDADTAARDAGAETLDLDERDADVALSDLGRRQAQALRRYLAEDADSRPTQVVSSPYRRALSTARTAVEGLDLEVSVDERLRERDLGVFDGLTGAGIRSRYPDESARREKLGKFYYEPPSGESWADVALRTRSLLSDLRSGYDGVRLWLVSHQAVIMSFRYVLEDLDEEHLLELDREVDLPNASLTTYVRDGHGYRLETFADTGPVDASEAEVTTEDSASDREPDSD